MSKITLLAHQSKQVAGKNLVYWKVARRFEMGWMQKLYNTYNQCEEWIGLYPLDGKRPLSPACHITKDAHVLIVLDADGNIQKASPIINRNEMTTIIPVTEDSIGKVGSTPAPHPFVEELRYLASDYVERGGKLLKLDEKNGTTEKTKKLHSEYKNLLASWCNSTKFSHPKACAVLKYIEKGTLVKDLADYGILYLGEDGKLLTKKDAPRSKDKDTKDIFAVPNITDQQDAVVRWRVEIDDGTKMDTWRDESLWKSWQDYYLNTRKSEKRSFCYVTGEEAILTNKHPKYIRKKGDNPKLISSNDKEMINYSGRLGLADDSSDAACLVGLETSQKAHNVLAWLIDRQGKVFEEPDGAGLTILAWEESARKEIIQPTQSSAEIFAGDSLPKDESEKPEAGQDFATRLTKKMMGYKADLKDSKGIYIIALDALTQGRMAITYYQEFEPEIYLENIEKWHRECAWRHHYLLPKEDDSTLQKPKKSKNAPVLRKPKIFEGTPSSLDIAEVIHGKDASAKIKHHTVSRLFACVVEGRSLPYDIVQSAIYEASKRMGLHDSEDKKSGDDEYTWRKALTIACALVKKYMIENNQIPKEKENNLMALDRTNKNRDYLYGRLLAIADFLERSALRDDTGNQKRSTNAARMTQQFSQRPYYTWTLIHNALSPYIVNLKGRVSKYKKEMAEVSHLFLDGDFKSDDPLTGEYLLGYYCQWYELEQERMEALKEWRKKHPSLNNNDVDKDNDADEDDYDNEFDFDDEDFDD
ncbi:MAG: type I-C CRISPR-associated protein Cas8c/Csd1 [Anaerolineales bacterium]|nr:type I-C CRISPR-associated protein Cas8c/Csd1 [Anaerolineales bacterium]